MNQRDKDRIRDLAENIKFNTARKEEYQEYYDLLIKYGIDKEIIDEHLANGNVKRISDIYRLRMTGSEIRKQQIRSYAITGLVGLGLGLLLYWTGKK